MKEKQRRLICRFLTLLLLLTVLTPSAVPAGYGNGYIGGLAGDGMGIYAHGLDLSTWQGHTVDFDKISEQGYRFVILRAGYAQTKDDCFEENYTRAKEAGLDVGVYLYSYAETKEDALAEAQACKGWLAGKQLEYPVYYDIEDPQAHASLTKEALTTLALTFLDEMAADGWLVGLYSCQSWLADKLDTQRICAVYECWMALYLNSGSYDTAENYQKLCGMWQYSCSGTVEGVPGLSDMNVAFKDYPSICREYGLNGYSASGAPLRLSAAAVPDILVTGSTYAVQGKVSSTQGNLSNVTVGVYDAQDNMLTGRSAGPRAKSYDLSELAAGVKFQTLTAGTYTLRITATNSAATRVLLSQTLTICDSGVTAQGVTIPEGFKEGGTFALNGSLYAASELLQVTVSVLDEQGKAVCSAAASPDERTFELQTLSEQISLSALSVGSYTYQVSVKTAQGTAELISLAFSVWEKNDPITLENFSLRESYFYGELQGLSGTVSSTNSNLSFLQLSLTDAFGEVIAQTEASSLGKQAELNHYNAALFAQTLPFGSYLCKITAKNAAGPVVLCEQTVCVIPDAISLCGADLPVVLQAGDALVPSGTVASDTTRLCYVSLCVYDLSLNAVLCASTVPQSYAYDLSQLGGCLPFSDLKPGEYRLKITAENEHEHALLYDAPLCVTDTSDGIDWESGHFRLDAMSYTAGDSPVLWGTLNSAGSGLTNFSAELYNEETVLVGTAERFCDGGQADIAALNEQLRFSALPEGAYSLKINARNASGTYCVAFERFVISRCRHSNVTAGAHYTATCTNSAVVCNSRCLSCGAAVRCGSIGEACAHQFAEKSCVFCGRKAPDEIVAAKTEAPLDTDGRYMLAFESEGKVYALNADAGTVQLEPADANAVHGTAQLLWALVRVQDGYALMNYRGEKLHFNSDGLSVGAGNKNATITITAAADGIRITGEDSERRLDFENDAFVTDFDGISLVYYEWRP